MCLWNSNCDQCVSALSSRSWSSFHSAAAWKMSDCIQFAMRVGRDVFQLCKHPGLLCWGRSNIPQHSKRYKKHFKLRLNVQCLCVHLCVTPSCLLSMGLCDTGFFSPTNFLSATMHLGHEQQVAWAWWEPLEGGHSNIRRCLINCYHVKNKSGKIEGFHSNIPCYPIILLNITLLYFKAGLQDILQININA